MIDNTQIDDGSLQNANEYFASINITEKSFSDNYSSNIVLSGLKFNIIKNEFLGILGPSGCGKTTLLRHIAGLDNKFQGIITIKNVEVQKPGVDRGLMFQESRLFPWLRVKSNIAFALPRNTPKTVAKEKVLKVLELVNLLEEKNKWPYQLSGGMLKRIALARAIINEPKLLLLDEPLTAIDEPSKHAIQDRIAEIFNDPLLSPTIILVTHDVAEAVYLSKRILILSPKPCHVINEVKISLPYPRNRASQEYKDMVAHISNIIFSNWRFSKENKTLQINY